MFAIQHRGIASTAAAQKLLAIVVLVPLLLVGLVPILTGAIQTTNITGLLPPSAAYSGVDGAWNNGGWTLFLGAGAKVWGYENALLSGVVFAALISPVFAYRHWYQDGGRFPAQAMAELGLKDGDIGERKAGMLPYLTLLLGAGVVLWANWFFQLPA